MIELHADAGTATRARLVLRPNRSLSAAQLRSVVMVLGAVALGTAVFSWTQGNAFAPLFALLHMGFVALCLFLAWRRGDRSEVIALGPDAVEVWRGPEGETAFSAHPHWVRLSVSPDGRVWLGSHGRHVEIGGFLGEPERGRLAAQLKTLLAAPGGADGGEPSNLLGCSR